MPPKIDVIIAEPRWQMINLPLIASSACTAALNYANAQPNDWEVALLACSDQRIAELNFQFRNRNQSTNVLSWPAANDLEHTYCDHSGGVHLGDIALAWETCSAEASAYNSTMVAHVSHLIVHACLHLLGFSHYTDEETTEMQFVEAKALASIGITSPYAEINTSPKVDC